jgi:hypothetical protein
MMTMLTVRTNPELLEHLRQHEHDGATVESLLFEGGRLSYPGRKEIEYQLGYTEPYTLELEARVIEGMPPRWNSAARFLSRLMFDRLTDSWPDPTLELLWAAHQTFKGPPSLDRLVASLVCIEFHKELVASEVLVTSTIMEAAQVLVNGLHSVGLPPTHEGLEELFDGAPPACVGLGLVEL